MLFPVFQSIENLCLTGDTIVLSHIASPLFSCYSFEHLLAFCLLHKFSLLSRDTVLPSNLMPICYIISYFCLFVKFYIIRNPLIFYLHLLYYTLLSLFLIHLNPLLLNILFVYLFLLQVLLLCHIYLIYIH